jgi:WD40 repeat protein
MGTTAATSGSRAKMRQLLHELTEMPTLAIHVTDHVANGDGDIGRALFSNKEGTAVVFHTKTRLSIFDIETKKIVAGKRLQNPDSFKIHSIAANPHTGIVAACIESPSQNQSQALGPNNVVFVWKSRNGFTNELVRLSLKPFVGENRFGLSWPYTTDLTMSRNANEDESVTIVVRLRDGQVYSWTLDGACSQVRTEGKLTEDGHNVALSDDGQWIAVASSGVDGMCQTTVHYQQEDVDEPEQSHYGVLAEFDQKHNRIAVTRINEPKDGHPAHGFLAAAYDAPSGGSPGQALVQVWSLPEKQLLHEFSQDSNCRALSFSLTPSLLISAHDDGTVMLSDLIRKTKSTSCDEEYITSLDVSVVGNRVVSASKDYLRVYKAGGGPSAGGVR